MSRAVQPVGMAAVGAYLPQRVITNDEVAAKAGVTAEWLLSRSGIRERRAAAPAETSASMGVAAARQALERAGLEADQVDPIICATATPDMLTPSTACLIQQELGCPGVPAFDVGAGCSGFLYAMILGAQCIASSLCQNALVVGAECLSRFIRAEDRSTALLFGDGGGAVVLQPARAGRGILGTCLGADGSGSPFIAIPGGGGRYPASQSTVSQQLHTVHMAGAEVYRWAVRTMPVALSRALAQAGLAASQLDMLVPHQANLHIIRDVGHRLGIPAERTWVNLEQVGNTSAASIPLALDAMWEQGRLHDDMLLGFTSFGAGFTWAAAVVRWGL